MTHSAELITQANAKARAMDYAGAVKLAQDAVAKSPENDNAYVALASMQLRNNQKAQALTTLKKALDINPANKRYLPKNPTFKDLANDPDVKKLLGQ